MPDLWSDLLACLNFDTAHSETRFTAHNQHLEYHRVFGGQLLAQFTHAASLVCPDKTVKSLHAVFPREGRADEPVEYDVVRHHVGRSFGTLSIAATQSKGPMTGYWSRRTAKRRFCAYRTEGQCMPIPLEHMAAVSPAYTANRAVNAVPWVCAAAPGIVSTLDLPHVLPRLT